MDFNKKMYIKNVVDYLYSTNTKISEDNLKTLYKKIFPDADNDNIGLIDLTRANLIIDVNDYEKMVAFLDNKYNVYKIVADDYIHEKVDSLWQVIVNHCEEYYNSSSREDFINKLSNYEKTAIIFKQFDDYFDSGDLLFWYSECSNDIEYMKDFLSNSDFKRKETISNVLNMLKKFSDAVKKLDRDDDWYDDDYDTRRTSLNETINEYDNIRYEFIDYMENYFIINIPDEYKELIKNLEIKL